MLKKSFSSVALTLTLLCVIATVAGCGDPKTKTFKSDKTNFTFQYPGNFDKNKVDKKNTDGQVIAFLQIDRFNAIGVRPFGNREARNDQELITATNSALPKEQILTPARIERRSGRSMAVVEFKDTVDGKEINAQFWSFSGGGKTWGMQCQWRVDQKKRDEVLKACKQATTTIKFS